MNEKNILFVLIGLLVLSGGAFMFYRISQDGINKIKTHEALRLQPYRDSAGLWTIGYGHLIKPDEWWNEITEEFAEQLLKNDLAIAESAVKDFVEITITQNQYDALVSFVFNVGVNAFENSTLLKKLNAGDPSVVDEFLRWNKTTINGKLKVVAGLTTRRERERDLFLA